jgi:endonuclease/exonuclease/phosphatase family metal-dependent hydrolase
MLRVLSYNIHKGFNLTGRALVTAAMKTAMHDLKPDLLLLQEVVGLNENFRVRFKEWPALPQHEFFTSEYCPYPSYGQNALYPHGHHGNAVISRLPFGYEMNVDATVFSFERRGFLHVQLDPAHSDLPLHAICTHFGLLEHERQKQALLLSKYIREKIPQDSHLVVAGDFNDWKGRLSPIFAKEVALKEVFLEKTGLHARSFPSALPVMRLDRIYYRNLVLKGCERPAGEPWTKLSDHLPLVADFEYP